LYQILPLSHRLEAINLSVYDAVCWWRLSPRRKGLTGLGLAVPAQLQQSRVNHQIATVCDPAALRVDHAALIDAIIHHNHENKRKTTRRSSKTTI